MNAVVVKLNTMLSYQHQSYQEYSAIDFISDSEFCDACCMIEELIS